MQICFVTAGGPDEITESEGADIVCLPFSALGEVNFEKELKGESSLFEDIAIASGAGRNVVLAGCFTDSRGIRRKSVVAAERGKILGVADSGHCLDETQYRCGTGAKLFFTAAGKLGVLVGEDLYFPHMMESLSLCGADAVFCFLEEMNGLEQTLIRAGAFFYGVSVCLCACGYAQIASPDGKLAFASAKSPCVFSLPRGGEYHLVETRKKLCLSVKRDY